MRSKKFPVNILLFGILGLTFFAPALLSAQTAAELERILETPYISSSQAARFVLASASGTADISADAALQSAIAKGWLPRKTAANDPISMGTLSYLTMKAFDLRGGLMYSIVPGPRYAFRSMVNRSFIEGAADPAMKVSGEKFLLILGNVLDAAGGEE